MRTVAWLGLGLLLAVASWGPLRNVFSDYQDSPVWVYVLFGGPLLALAALCFAAAVRSGRHR